MELSLPCAKKACIRPTSAYTRKVTPHRETQKDCGTYQLYNSIKQQGFVAQAAGSITGMFWQRNYLCAVGMQGSGTADRATVKSFLTFISNKIKKRYQKEE